jgi:protein-disulfide isomerase
MADRTDRSGIAATWFLLGWVGLAAALIGAGVLVAHHFAAMALPGCGPGSACDALTAGPWGRVPGLRTPVSFLGLAWFVAAALGWAMARRGGVGAPLRWLVRLGAAASVLFLVVMSASGHFCIYCTTAHAGNLLFLVAVECAGAAGPASPLQPLKVAGVGLVALILLVTTDLVRGEQVKAGEREQLTQSQEEILAQPPVPPARPFTGRYRLGDVDAPIRVVLISDFQCPDCYEIEQQVRRILAVRQDVSVSAKHFPMCSDCNPYMRGSNLHRNACWAARAAETAGMLRGNEGFWAMHHWLYEVKGEFTNVQLRQQLTAMGYDPDQFISTMQGPETLARVQEDIEEAKELGLHFTPMVFVNGKELKGFRARDALVQTVERVAATSPPRLGPEHDQPPRAAEKLVADWRDQILRTVIPGPEASWTRGAEQPKVRVVVWGDVSSTFSADLQKEVMRLVETRGDVQYSFLQYPVQKACNRYTQSDQSPYGCLATRAAEAAGVMGGGEGYWRMHDWILAHLNGFGESSIEQAAADLGLDATELRRVMGTPQVDQAISADTQAALGAGVDRFIPSVFVNFKWVPRWRLEGHDILGTIVAEAAQAGLPTVPSRGRDAGGAN